MATNNSVDNSRLEQLRDLALQKEQEWRDTLNLRIAALESTCSKHEEDLRNERTRYDKLKNDFLFNLRLLNDRDRELEQYDTTVAEMRATLLDRDAQLSELHAEVDKLEEKLQLERQRSLEQQRFISARSDEQFGLLENARNESEKRCATLQNELDLAKRRLEQHRVEFQSKLESERTEIRLDFDRQLAEIEQKHRNALASSDLAAVEKEARAKQLESDNNRLRAEIVNLRERLEEKIAEMDEVRRRAAHFDWLATDSQRAVETVRTDLQREIDAARSELEANAARFAQELADRERRIETERTDSARRLRDLEHRLAASAESSALKATEWTARERELLAELDVAKNEMRLKDEELEKLNRDCSLEKTSHLAELRRVDAELRNAKSEHTRLETERYRERDKLERLEAELRKARERESLLDAQIAALNRERNALVKANQQSEFQYALPHAPEQAKHVRIRTDADDDGQPPADSAETVPRSEFDALQSTNEKLVRTIRAMRSELESIRNSQSPQKSKAKLDARVEAEAEAGAGVEAVKPKIVDPGLAAFVDRLTSELEEVRRERVSAVTQCRKQAARIAHLERVCHQLEQAPREQRNVVEQLEYALSTQRRRYEAESSALKADLDRLSLRLTESQRDADAFHREMLAAQSESAAFRQELADAKLQLASRSAPSLIQFGAPELTIEQLKTECARLRALLVSHQQKANAGAAVSHASDGNSPLDVTRESADAEMAQPQPHQIQVQNEHDAAALRAQLQRALLRIRQLQAERAHLLEMGNRLRARLKLAEAGTGAARADPASELERDQVADLIQGKLRELEAMQYALTTRQLASARQAAAAAAAVDEAGATARSEHERGSGVKKRQQEATGGPAKRGVVTSSIDMDAGLDTDTARPSSRSAARSNPQLLASVSSIGAESLSGVWRMLDDQPSFLTPRSPSKPLDEADENAEEPERDNAGTGKSMRRGLTVSGRAVQPEDRAPRQRSALSSRAAGKAGNASKKVLVRKWDKPQ